MIGVLFQRVNVIKLFKLEGENDLTKLLVILIFKSGNAHERLVQSLVLC